MQNLDLKGFQQALSEAKSVVILMPEKPSLDTVASATALSLVLSQDNKEVTVACPSPMLVEFNRLVGVQKVTDSIENRNLTISFEDYEATNVERVSYNIENGKFMLVIAPKTGKLAPNKDQVVVGYRGVAGDLVIVVGTPSKDALGKFNQEKELFVEGSKVALVNNTPVSGFSSASELISPDASSISEATLRVIEGLNLHLNPDIATNLLAGLRAGTDSFQKAVAAETFSAASRLVSAGARLDSQGTTPNRIQSQPQAEKPPASWIEEPRILKGNTLP